MKCFSKIETLSGSGGKDSSVTEGGPSSALVLGGGEIGIALAGALTRRVERLAVHCRRESSMQRAREYLSSNNRGQTVELRFSTGDVFIPSTDLVINDEIAQTAITTADCYTMLASPPSSERPHRISAVSAGMDVILDCTNAATSLADSRIYGAFRQACGCHGQDGCPACEGRAIRAIRHFVVALDGLLRTGKITRYVKVSTTGLGAMGMDVPFTHGDVSSEVLSPALWEKLELAGTMHNALWALQRTFPGRVSLVVPAACVGFPASATIVAFGSAPAAEGDPGERMRSGRQVPAVWLGEGRFYSLDEMLLLSSPLLMGSLTAQEVAQAVVEVLDGNPAHDCLQALSSAALWSSEGGLAERSRTREMLLSAEGFERGAILGSLGPLVAARLLEVQMMQRALGRLTTSDPLGICADELSVRAVKATLDNTVALDSAEALGLHVAATNAEAEKGQCPIDLSPERCLKFIRAAEEACESGYIPRGVAWADLDAGDLCAALLRTEIDLRTKSSSG